jgi:hypothetical protein
MAGDLSGEPFFQRFFPVIAYHNGKIRKGISGAGNDDVIYAEKSPEFFRSRLVAFLSDYLRL